MKSFEMKSSRKAFCRMRNRMCGGQALTEFIVIALALVPLFLLIPMIAKYQDISHATQVAARYVAFEATIHNDAMGAWKPEGQLADEVRRRFFSNIDAPIKTNDTAGNFKANQNLFWRDPKDDALIHDFNNDVTVSFGAGNGSSHSAAFSGTADGAPFPLGNQMDLHAQGIYTANVSVKLAKLPALSTLTGAPKSYEPFDQINLSMARSTSVVIDPWTASGSSQTESRSGSPAVFPASSLMSVSPLVDADVAIIDAPGGFSGPRLGRLDFWRDVVPTDRLKTRN